MADGKKKRISQARLDEIARANDAIERARAARTNAVTGTGVDRLDDLSRRGRDIL